MLTTFLLHIFLVPITDGQWISYTNPAVPKKDIQMAVGVWNDHVFLLGGYNTLTRRSLIEFDGSQFDDKGEVLPINTWGYGDYYAQIENNLFMIDPTMSRLNVFNMALTTNQFTTFAIIPSDVNEQGCLATDSDHLFVVGGYSYSSSSPLDTVQILDIAEMSWQNGVSMKTARKQLSCIVDPYTKTLYAIGGNNGTDINSVEFINTTIMDTWESIQPGLTNPAVAARSVVHVQTIYVVGGRYWDGAGHELDTVHIINPQQNTITLSNDRLPYGVYHLALCVIDNFLHGFGGSDDYGYSDKWMKYQLPSPPTTNTPTSILFHCIECQFDLCTLCFNGSLRGKNRYILMNSMDNRINTETIPLMNQSDIQMDHILETMDASILTTSSDPIPITIPSVLSPIALNSPIVHSSTPTPPSTVADRVDLDEFFTDLVSDLSPNATNHNLPLTNSPVNTTQIEPFNRFQRFFQ
eukprot:205297_1